MSLTHINVQEVSDKYVYDEKINDLYVNENVNNVHENNDYEAAFGANIVYEEIPDVEKPTRDRTIKDIEKPLPPKADNIGTISGHRTSTKKTCFYMSGIIITIAIIIGVAVGVAVHFSSQKQGQEEKKEHHKDGPNMTSTVPPSSKPPQNQGPSSSPVPSPVTSPTPVPSPSPSPSPVVSPSPVPSPSPIQSSSPVPSPSPTTVSPSGSWGPWTAWSSCTLTCGDGRQQRTRECSTTSCDGESSEIQGCRESDCPESPSWSSWSPWSSCSVTCGSGSQTRSRTCSGASCVGDSVHSRDCPGWQCPDCSFDCGTGKTLNADCTRCECEGTVLNGKVTTTTNIPITQVKISDAKSPYAVITESNEDGQFSVNDACSMQMLLFENPKYDSKVVSVDSIDTSLDVQLLEHSPLRIIKEPEDKYRVSGENVVLCCAATGTPMPQYYEWFKNDDLVSTHTTSGESTYEIVNLSEEDSGSYKCRANTDLSAVISRTANVVVKAESSDYCPENPEPFVEILPEGCRAPDGGISIDTGRCPNIPCAQRVADRASGCVDEVKFCCGPASQTLVTLTCDDGIDRIHFVVTKCGCQECAPSTPHVIGVAQDAKTKLPVSYLDVEVNGTLVTSTDLNGQFSFQAPEGVQRLSITIKDSYLEYVETTILVNVHSDPRVPIYVVANLLPMAPPVEISSTEESVLTMGQSGSEFADITLPPNMYFTADGKMYNGTVKASLNVINPNNMDDAENAPGDFTFVDSEGNSQSLQTFGMFSFYFSDANGNPLQTDGEIQITLDSKFGGNETDENGDLLTRMWTLDPETGKWVEAGKFELKHSSTLSRRKKRWPWVDVDTNVLIGNMQWSVKRRWTNFDIYKNEMCYSKVRLFKNNVFDSTEQLSGAFVSSYLIDKSLGPNYGQLSRVMAWSDWNYPGNGYCVAHLCDIGKLTSKNYEGYLKVELNVGNELKAMKPSNTGIDQTIKDKIDFKIEGDAIYSKLSTVLQSGDTGPFYNYDSGWWGYSDACSSAKVHRMGDDPSTNEFRFYKDEFEYNCTENSYVAISTEKVTKATDPSYFYAWYASDVLGTKPMACFIKVVTSGNHSEIKFRATSSVGIANIPELSVTPNEVYGTQEACMNATGAVCLEVKAPGLIGEGNNGRKKGRNTTDETDVIVEPRKDKNDLLNKINCTLADVNDNFEVYIQSKGSSYPNIGVDGTKYKLRLIKNNIIFDRGIYCRESGTTDIAKETAKKACLSGVSPKEPDSFGDTNNDNYLLKYHCINHGIN